MKFIKIKSPVTFAVLKALQDSAEGGILRDAGGYAWKDVYLDNAKAGCDLAPLAFAAQLQKLKAAGLYIPQDGEAFGRVRMPASN